MNIDARKPFEKGTLYSLPALEKQGLGKISRLPVSLRVVLESLLRNLDGKRVREQDVRALASWQPKAGRTEEIPFVVARVLLQDFTGVPLVVDLAAMRSAVNRAGREPKLVEPRVPVDLVIDHSVQVDFARVANAIQLNMGIEFTRNRARYEFLKWGMQAFDGLQIVPPGMGIVHQVNLEYLAPGVHEQNGVFYPDSLVGTDSHTTMINGLGIVAWGVGGIEAEAAMLGQPVYFLTPDVIGVHLHGKLAAGVTATDVVLTVTEMLRKAKVVGKFVEFFGEGASSLPVPERATIANMAPEYGATMGYFPVDELSCQYMLATGRAKEKVDTMRAYYKAQGLFGIPGKGDCDYTQVLELDLSAVRPSVAGPKRPQDRIDLPKLKEVFSKLLVEAGPNGYAKPKEELGKRFHEVAEPFPGVVHVEGGGSQETESAPEVKNNGLTTKNTNPTTETEMMQNRPTPDRVPAQEVHQMRMPVDLGHGDVLIAAITSCTNTSNPSVMLAAGILARKAVEKGLTVRPEVKTSLAPGSRVVSRYLERTGLQPYLDKLGFVTVGYGCTTCIGNSGPLDPHIEQLVTKNDIIAASVLSGNRNFEARVHQSIKANFLMSPPLVVAFAIAGRVDVDLDKEPIGLGRDGKPVFLRDVWPSAAEVNQAMGAATDPDVYRHNYGGALAGDKEWKEIPAPHGLVYAWDPKSTYIQEPPYFESFVPKPAKLADLRGARPLAIFGDSVTTDHISPAGSIKANSPAGKYLVALGVKPEDFNSYGARRGNHHVMVRGTFANVRIKNLMVPGVEGGVTVVDGKQMAIYDAAIEYQKRGTPLVIFAGHEYGTGSSRDWAAKGTRLLGVRAVVAKSFERIHRSNLVMMGVLPCHFKEGTDAASLKLNGTETYDLLGFEQGPSPMQDARLVIHRSSGTTDEVAVKVRIDTPIEVEYYKHGGILPYVLRQILGMA